MIELIFTNEKQIKIFLLLINNPKGLIRKDILERLCLKRTTCFDNIEKLINRKIIINNNNYPYIKYYDKQCGKVGRPLRYFYIPKIIKNSLLTMNIETTNNYNIILKQ